MLLGMEKTLLIDFPIFGVLTGALLLIQAAGWIQHRLSFASPRGRELGTG